MIQNPTENVDGVQDNPTGHFRRQVKAPADLNVVLYLSQYI